MTRRPYGFVKRTIDFILASVLLILTLPIQVVIAVLVMRQLGTPVLFRQERPGLDGKVFTLVKFRTMKSINVSLGQLSDADRLTPFGKLLRSTSLDELPTLWNVIRGDMSIVGPRPLLVEYLPRYSQEQARRHEVRPGITGLAQVSGRNAISWDEKFELDVAYVNTYSPILDMKIVLRTFTTVFTRRGISHYEHVTMAPFEGPMLTNVVVIGAGGFGRETLDVIEAHNEVQHSESLNILGVVDDSPSTENQNRLSTRGYKYLGSLESLSEIEGPFLYLVGVGNPTTRAKIVELCDGLGLKAGKVVHPMATIGSEARIGSGTIVCAGAQISTNVSLGRHVHVNPGAVIGHDTIVGDFTSLNPRSVISGNVFLGEKTLIGANAVILQGLRIFANSIVGASSCVTKNIDTPQTVIGIPAVEFSIRRLDSRELHEATKCND